MSEILKTVEETTPYESGVIDTDGDPTKFKTLQQLFYDGLIVINEPLVDNEEFDSYEEYFNYDLDRMKVMVESAKTNYKRVPKEITTVEGILEWLDKQ